VHTGAGDYRELDLQTRRVAWRPGGELARGLLKDDGETGYFVRGVGIQRRCGLRCFWRSLWHPELSVSQRGSLRLRPEAHQ